MSQPRNIHEIDPVREFTGDPRRLAISLQQMLQELRQQLVEQLASIECKTFDEYRARRGKIEGIDIAINFCKEAQRKLEA
jgi:hypothetical protein